MKTMKKIVAILAVALLLCSMLPLSVMADENVADLDTISSTNTSYTTVTTTKGWKATNAAVLSGGSSNSSPKFSFIDSSTSTKAVCLNGKTSAKGTLTSPTLSGGISKLTFSYGLPFSDTKIGLSITVTGADGTVATTTVSNTSATKYTKYDFEWELDTPITGDFTIVISNTSPSNNSSSNKDRTAVWNIAWVGGNTDCDHDSLKCEETCSVCSAFTKDHEWDDCSDTQCNACSETRDAVEHTHSSDIDPKCDVCNASREIAPELIVDAAYALGTNAALADTYTLSGVITSVDTAYDETYGNVTVTITVFDSNGDLIEGKPVQCYRLKGDGANVIAVGYTITVSGIIKNYNGKVEFDAGCELVSYEAGECPHDYNYDCDKICIECGLETRPEAECSPIGDLCQDSECEYCGEIVAGLGHTYDSDYDADCNYCGEIREVPEAPAYATITFDNTSKRTEQTTETQVWTENGITVTNNKASSTSNIIDSSNPVRFYKNSELIVAFSNITSIEFHCNTAAYATALATSIGDSAVVNDKVVTISFDEAVNTYTVALTGGQVRMDSITVYSSASGDEDCEHIWVDANCTTPKTCSECGAVEGEALGHSYGEAAETLAPTCTTAGEKTSTCSVCGDEQVEAIPALGHSFVDGTCSVCGAEKIAGYAPITSADQFVSGQYVMVVETGYAPTYLDGSWVLTGQPTIVDGIVDDATDFLWTLTVDGSSVTITDANGITIAPKGGNENGIKSGEYDWTWSFEDGKFIFAGVDSDTVYLASNTVATQGDNRFRGYKQSTCTGDNAASYKYKFTLYAAPEEPVCEHAYDYDCSKNCNICGEETRPEAEHSYFYPCDVVCQICYQETNPDAAHSVKHVEAVAATCSANGNIEYWYCEHCGAAWADEAHTQVTNMMSVVVPATGEHTYDDDYDADCNVCGDVREVPDKPVETAYGDVNGDSEIDILDEALLSQYINGWDVTLDEVAADVNCDGEIDILDEALLSQYINGWDVTLGPVVDGPLFNDGELNDWPV